MKDYSQDHEQAAILAALGLDGEHESSGRALDIGAWHATDKSNTRALYELGWNLVLIEPSPGPMRGLLAEYGRDPRVTLVQAAVAITPGFLTLLVTDDAVTSADPAVQETWKELGGYLGELRVPAITLEQIAMNLGGFDFVSIDAEGLSVDLFSRMMALGHYPPVLCVEHDGRTTELLSCATAHGYHAVYCNGTNMVVKR